MDVKFEYLGEDLDFPEAKVWSVEAIHVTTTRNKRKFTRAELEASGRSLSFRPLNINHDNSRQMPFPENATLAMHFNPQSMAVEGKFRVMDSAVNAMIETGRINSVSIEQIPTLGETCNEIMCEQHGVAFVGMALLESNVLPGDPATVNKIKRESIRDLLVTDEQRTCKECTDNMKCESCRHNTEQNNACVQSAIREISDNHPDWPRDKVIAAAFSKCKEGESTKEEAWNFYNQAREVWREIIYP